MIKLEDLRPALILKIDFADQKEEISSHGKYSHLRSHQNILDPENH